MVGQLYVWKRKRRMQRHLIGFSSGGVLSVDGCCERAISFLRYVQASSNKTITLLWSTVMATCSRRVVLLTVSIFYRWWLIEIWHKMVGFSSVS